MKFTHVRNEFSDTETVGTVLCDDGGKSWWQCEALEDTDRKLEDNPDDKVPGRTAIPRGKYKLAWTWSHRFKRYMLLLQDVPGFSGVRIHAGNEADDTDGCILVGKSRSKGRINDSRLALADLEALVVPRLTVGEEVFWEII